MAKVSQAYADNNGALHATPLAAVLADLAGVLGRVSSDVGMTSGLAKLIVDKREEIEKAYADLDAMQAVPQ